MAFDPSFLLFVPGDRPDRFEKALASEASGVILDLEDAVALEKKAEAREAVGAFLRRQSDLSRIAVRTNALKSSLLEADLAMLKTAPRCGALMLPKVPRASALESLAQALEGVALLALIESAGGVLHAADIAAHPRCIALAFGPFDLAADLGGASDWNTMLPHRTHLLLAARANGKAALEGPTLTWTDPVRTESETRPSARLGYDGKLLIHPAQIAPVRKAFAPTPEEVSRATQIVEAARHAMPAVVHGMMIDEPLLISARRILAHARACTP